MASAPAVVAAPAAFPPQLATLLGDAAKNVAAFGEMAPGVPWSNALLDEMLEGFDRVEHIYAFDRGDVRVSIQAAEQGRKTVHRSLQVQVLVKRSTDSWQYGSISGTSPVTLGFDVFTRDRSGLRAALEYARKKVNLFRKTGFCAPCLTAEPPKKRQRLLHASECIHCLTKKVIG